MTRLKTRSPGIGSISTGERYRAIVALLFIVMVSYILYIQSTICKGSLSMSFNQSRLLKTRSLVPTLMSKYLNCICQRLKHKLTQLKCVLKSYKKITYPSFSTAFSLIKAMFFKTTNWNNELSEITIRNKNLAKNLNTCRYCTHMTTAKFKFGKCIVSIFIENKNE